MGTKPVDEYGRPINMNYDHGTTTLGFKYQGGIVLAVDSRATGGQYIGNRFSSFLIRPHLYLVLLILINLFLLS